MTEETKTAACACASGSSDEIDLAPLDAILARHEDDPGALIPVLQATQEHYGYLPRPALEEVAARRGVPLSAVYGVGTFYAQFHLRPRGEHVLRICHGTACHVRGAPDVTRAVVEELELRVGETSEDLRFTLESVACVGCCGLAPVMLVDDRTYGQIDASDARSIAVALREGVVP
jgi:NADH:ubiquinone oxidoreductase subunit E